MIFKNMTITDIESFMSIPIKSGDYRKIVKRYASGIVFSPCGISKYYHGDKVYISDNTHVLFLPEDGTYTIECIEGDICPLINFRCNYKYAEIKAFSTKDSKKLIEKFVNFEKKWTFYKADNYYDGMAFIYGILAELSLENPERELEVPEILKKALNIIETNYNISDLSNDMIAKEIRISTVYFRKLFKKYYGKSPMKYLGETRIQQAMFLLKEQILNMQEISYAVGFTSLYSFSRAFKTSTGYSPSQYKKMSKTI